MTAVNSIANSASAQIEHGSGSRPVSGVDLAGSVPVFGSRPSSRLIDGDSFTDFSRKRLIFGAFTQLGQTHVYRVDCKAGDRLRAQLFVPVLPRGGSVLPTFAVVGAQPALQRGHAKGAVGTAPGLQRDCRAAANRTAATGQGCPDPSALLPRPPHRHPHPCGRGAAILWCGSPTTAWANM